MGRPHFLYETWPKALEQKVVAALMTGASLRVCGEIADCSVTVIQKYRDNVYKPAQERARKTMERKQLKENDTVTAVSPQELHGEVMASVAAQPIIAERQKRVAVLDDYWRRLEQVAAERGEDMAGVPGGRTGLLVRRQKSIGSGKDAQLVEEYELDAALLKELRAHAEQAAKELGQWTEGAGTGSTINLSVTLCPVPGQPAQASPIEAHATFTALPEPDEQ